VSSIKLTDVATAIAIYILSLISCPFGTTAQEFNPAPPHDRNSQESIDFYLRQVGPILKAKCYRCHGPEKNISPRIDETDWPVEFVALDEKPELSTLWRVHLFPPTDQSQEIMPPQKANDPLSPTDAKTLELWIQKGVPYSPNFDWYKFDESLNPPANQILSKTIFRVSLIGLILSSCTGLLYRNETTLMRWTYLCFAACALAALATLLMPNII
jgi:hypothetical protein